MGIHQWPKNDRPRERLLQYGAKILSDAELLAIFLRTGTYGKTALDLARDLLKAFDGLDKILEADYDSFVEIKGLGPAKYCQLQATLELVRRHYHSKVMDSDGFTNHAMVKQYLISHFPDSKNEIFACLLLDNQHRLLRFEPLFNGTINEAQVYPRVVAQTCLRYNAAAIIFAHNHPSGCLTPSKSDKIITAKLIETLDLIDVRVLDHFIVGQGDVFSMAQNGLINMKG